MQRYIAFLRAINVGGHTVKMTELRALFESMRLRNVETFIASGNVIFDSPARDAAALEDRIERHLERSLGYEVGTFLRTPEEVAAVAAHEPFGGDRGIRLAVAFLKSPPSDEGRAKVMQLRTEVDDFDVNGREVWWLARAKLMDSPVWRGQLEKTLGMPATFRGVSTVQKLAAKYPA